MRYVKGQKINTRNRIVEAASLALREKGADGMSVIELMKLAGLTHGGFYSHFESRDALVIEAFALAMDRTVASWLQLAEAKPVDEQFETIAESYLSQHHRDNPAQGCALPVLGADIARSGPKARRIFTTKLEEMIDALTRLLPSEPTRGARQKTIGALATMVGSVVLARAADDNVLSDDILEAGRHALRNQALVRTKNVLRRKGSAGHD